MEAVTLTDNYHTQGDKSKESRKEFTVLVTGFGPVSHVQGGRYNTSNLITKQLPETLPSSSSLNPTSIPIKILNPTAPDGQHVRPEYAYIRTYIQKMWDEYAETVDAVIHLGQAVGFEFYTVEERAFNEKFTSTWGGATEEMEGYYLTPDGVGKTVRDIGVHEGRGMWDDVPMGLATRVDVPTIIDDVMGTINSEDVREGEKKMVLKVVPHFEAGPYGCGYTFYESLATCWKRKLDNKVLFCHVPGWADEERLKRGADVVCAIIGAVCKQIHEER